MPLTSSIPRRLVPLAEERAALLTACQTHFQTHKAALAAAARLTAGAPGERLAERLCEDITAASRWQGAFTRRMRTLRGVLRLDHLDDPDPVYPVPVEVLEPDAARVADCCWQVERLEALIARSEALSARAMALPRVPSGRPARRRRVA